MMDLCDDIMKDCNRMRECYMKLIKEKNDSEEANKNVLRLDLGDNIDKVKNITINLENVEGSDQQTQIHYEKVGDNLELRSPEPVEALQKVFIRVPKPYVRAKRDRVLISQMMSQIHKMKRTIDRSADFDRVHENEISELENQCDIYDAQVADLTTELEAQKKKVFDLEMQIETHREKEIQQQLVTRFRQLKANTGDIARVMKNCNIRHVFNKSPSAEDIEKKLENFFFTVCLSQKRWTREMERVSEWFEHNAFKFVVDLPKDRLREVVEMNREEYGLEKTIGSVHFMHSQKKHRYVYVFVVIEGRFADWDAGSSEADALAKLQSHLDENVPQLENNLLAIDRTGFKNNQQLVYCDNHEFFKKNKAVVDWLAQTYERSCNVPVLSTLICLHNFYAARDEIMKEVRSLQRSQ